MPQAPPHAVVIVHVPASASEAAVHTLGGQPGAAAAAANRPAARSGGRAPVRQRISAHRWAPRCVGWPAAVACTRHVAPVEPTDRQPIILQPLRRISVTCDIRHEFISCTRCANPRLSRVCHSPSPDLDLENRPARRHAGRQQPSERVVLVHCLREPG